MLRWIAVFALATGVFIWGLAAGAYQLFPYPQARAVYHALTGADETAAREYIMTEVPVISAERYAALDTQAQIVMVGDSITASGRWDEMFPDASIINRGVNGDVIGGIEQRTDAVLRAGPEKIFVQIGINDIAAGNSNDQIIARYRKVIDALQADDATVYAQSVIPCRDFRLGPCTPAMREQAFALNGQLQALAEEENARFIDLAATMADENGFLPQYSLDGIHPGSAGFAEWRRILAPYIDGTTLETP